MARLSTAEKEVAVTEKKLVASAAVRVEIIYHGRHCECVFRLSHIVGRQEDPSMQDHNISSICRIDLKQRILKPKSVTLLCGLPQKQISDRPRRIHT